jgi:hypothetical protein
MHLGGIAKTGLSNARMYGTYVEEHEEGVQDSVEGTGVVPPWRVEAGLRRRVWEV